MAGKEGFLAPQGYHEFIMPKMSSHDLLIFSGAVDGLPPRRLPRSEWEKGPNAASHWSSGEHSFALHAMSRQKRKMARLDG